MSGLVEFLKTTVRGGFLVVLPILIFLLVLVETVDLIIALLGPITEWFPINEIGGVESATIIAILMLLLMSFLVGLGMKLPLGIRIGSWLNQNILRRLPGYTLVRNLAHGFAGIEAEQKLLQPAVVTMPLESLVLAFIVEEHENGYCTVFIPAVPTPTIGRIEYVSGQRVRRLDAPPASVANSMMQWGVGSGAWFRPAPDQT